MTYQPQSKCRLEQKLFSDTDSNTFQGAVNETDFIQCGQQVLSVSVALLDWGSNAGDEEVMHGAESVF